MNIIIDKMVDNNEIDYDTLFMELAGRSGSLDRLLEHFFGFLNRRTDFYITLDKLTDKDAKMGFPKGIAEQMVLRAMNKYKFKEYSTEKQNYEPKPTKMTNENLSISTNNSTIIDINEPKISNSSSSEKFIRHNEEGKQIPIGNGGIGPNYYWTQTLKDLTVYVDVFEGCRGKDIKCLIEPKKIYLSACGQVLIDGFFEEAIKVDESMWTLNISTNSIPQVVITLDKGRNTWWKHIIQGHPEIDTNKVDSSQKIDEYDESTQAAIRKIMFDQKQKRLGLQTSEEIEKGLGLGFEKDFLMQQALDSPGSPLLGINDPPPSPWDLEKGKKKS